MNLKKKHGARRLAVLVTSFVLCINSMPIHAEDSVEDLEQQTNTLKNQVNDLNSEITSVSEELQDLVMKINSTKEAMEATAYDLANAEVNEKNQYEDMKLRIKQIYENGDFGYLEFLCSAEDMNDLLNKADFVKAVNEYDRQKLQELIDIRNSIEETQNELKDEEVTLNNLQVTLNKKQADLKTKLSQAEKDLSATSEQLASAKAAIKAAEEAAKKKAEQEAKEREEAAKEQVAQKPSAPSTPSAPPSGGSSSGGESSGGSSQGGNYLGVFKITHYCPCSICCGPNGGDYTASGTRPTAGRTIAVDKRVIPFGTKVVINGHIYVAEDSGGAIKGNRIDIFVNTHQEALNKGVYYAKVYKQ